MEWFAVQQLMLSCIFADLLKRQLLRRLCVEDKTKAHSHTLHDSIGNVEEGDSSFRLRTTIKSNSIKPAGGI